MLRKILLWKVSLWKNSLKIVWAGWWWWKHLQDFIIFLLVVQSRYSKIRFVFYEWIGYLLISYTCPGILKVSFQNLIKTLNRCKMLRNLIRELVTCFFYSNFMSAHPDSSDIPVNCILRHFRRIIILEAICFINE